MACWGRGISLSRTTPGSPTPAYPAPPTRCPPATRGGGRASSFLGFRSLAAAYYGSCPAATRKGMRGINREPNDGLVETEGITRRQANDYSALLSFLALLFFFLGRGLAEPSPPLEVFWRGSERSCKEVSKGTRTGALPEEVCLFPFFACLLSSLAFLCARSSFHWRAPKRLSSVLHAFSLEAQCVVPEAEAP